MGLKEKNQVKLGAILSYLSLGVTNIIGILYTPIMLRILGQSEYGLYTLSNSIVGYLGVLNFGLGNAIIRYTAKYKAQGDREGEYKLNGMFMVIYSLLGVLVFVLGTLFIFKADIIFSNSLTASELGTMKILLPLMVFNLAISFPFAIFESIIVAYEQFVFPKVMGIIRSLINPMIMIPLLFMGYKSVAMTVLSTILNLICIGLNVYYCFKVLKIKIVFKNFDYSLLKEIGIYSFFIFLNLIVDRIYWGTDQFILGAMVSSSAVAIYAVGSQFNMYYMAFSTAMSNVFLPKITKMVTLKATDKEISDLFIKIGRLQFIILGFILSGFILVGKEFIKLWAGNGYDAAFYIAIVVMIPLTIPLIQNLGISILQAKNKHKFRSTMYLVIAVLNILLTLILAKTLGGFGAALSTGVSFFIGNILIINVYYYKKINIDIPRFWREISKIGLTIVTSIIVVINIDKVLGTTGITHILTRAILLATIYGVVMWNFVMNEYEKNLLEIPMKKVKEKFLKKGDTKLSCEK